MNGNQIARASMQAMGGAIPFVGGILSAVAGCWSEAEQDKINLMLLNWVKMIEEEMVEKTKTIEEVIERIDMHSQEETERMASPEYQSILKKTFRNWSTVDSEEKRILIRNILANSVCSHVASDDVVKMFIDWIDNFSELHIKVISAIYNSNGITRAQIWQKLGKAAVREDSADADLFKLIIRELSTGGIIRQHRDVTYDGQFINKPKRTYRPVVGVATSASAFDNSDSYELTDLGNQFVHYTMTDVPIKLEYKEAE